MKKYQPTKKYEHIMEKYQPTYKSTYYTFKGNRAVAKVFQVRPLS